MMPAISSKSPDAFTSPPSSFHRQHNHISKICLPFFYLLAVLFLLATIFLLILFLLRLSRLTSSSPRPRSPPHSEKTPLKQIYPRGSFSENAEVLPVPYSSLTDMQHFIPPELEHLPVPTIRQYSFSPINAGPYLERPTKKSPRVEKSGRADALRQQRVEKFNGGRRHMIIFK